MFTLKFCNFANMKYLMVLVAVSFMACNSTPVEECSDFELIFNSYYTAAFNGEIIVNTSGVKGRIIVNDSTVSYGESLFYPVKKGDTFKVSKSNSQNAHSFNGWFRCN